MQGCISVATGHQAWSQPHPQSDCSLPINPDMPQMQNQNIMACRADLMSVEQTAAWVRTLGYFKGWEEAIEYENSFRSNQIKGYLLQSLTLDSLKSDLGIWMYGHRLEIMEAIKSLFPNMREMSSTMPKSTFTNSPIRSSMVLSGRGSGNLSSAMIYSPVVTFGTPQSVPQYSGMCYSPNVRSDVTGIKNDSPIQSTEVRSDDTGIKNGSPVQSTTMSNAGKKDNEGHTLKSEEPSRYHWCSNCNSGDKIISSTENPSKKKTDETDQSKAAKRAKKKSKRAGPSNPVEYMTLRDVQVRVGKSVTSKVVGELSDKQIVVINQIKGRSGRVVEKTQDGKYTKLGWVPLFTASGRQLLVKKR